MTKFHIVEVVHYSRESRDDGGIDYYENRAWDMDAKDEYEVAEMIEKELKQEGSIDILYRTWEGEFCGDEYIDEVQGEKIVFMEHAVFVDCDGDSECLAIIPTDVAESFISCMI